MQINPVALRQWRTERAMTLVALAAESGIAQPNLSKMEAGEEQPSYARLLKLAAALRIEPGSLIGPDVDPRLVDETIWPFRRGKKRVAA